MNSALPRITTEPRKNHLTADFLVGQFIPFVCYLNSIFIPFVCKNTPNSTFQPVTRRIHGFTLIELVVTMAVAAILVTVAVPSFRTLIQNNRMSTQVNELITDISYARSEAIKRRSNVGITTSTTGTCASGGIWRNGRVIFVDVNNDSICDANDTILRFREPLASAADSLTTTVVGDPIFFSANGASPNIPVGGAAQTFTFCDDRGASYGKLLNLNNIGQATLNRTALPPTCL